MKFSFRIWQKRPDGGPNRRFHKVRYTAALRFGVVLDAAQGFVEVSFDGETFEDVKAHVGNEAYIGQFHLGAQSFGNVVVITKQQGSGKVGLITFWPQTQQPDAHHSYTDPLVDTAMDGTPFDIQKVAGQMHDAFRENAGASPATLMKIIYDDEFGSLRDSAFRLSELLEESFRRERETSEALDMERASRQQVEAKNADLVAENEELRALAYIAPPKGAAVDSSEPVMLERASEDIRGKFNQRAVLLHMSDGTVRANNWERGFEARLAYAKNLEGKLVRTDVWGGYSCEKWFKNIYPVQR